MNWFRLLLAVVVALHGLVHLMGTAAYLRLAQVQALPYKTTVLGGRLDLGAGGTAAFGVLWALCALGFLAAAMALVAQWPWWSHALVSAALLSLGLTILDVGVAYAGVAVNVAILGVVWLAPGLVMAR